MRYGNMDTYLDINPLNIFDTWAVYVEIFATTLMLNIDMYLHIENIN